MRSACATRSSWIPTRSAADFDHYLSPAFLDADAKRIDPKKAARWPAPYGEGDTIWMGAADASGLVVSYIQSLYWEFGSGCVLPRTGIVMQNRGASFSLDPKALNALAPGRRPFHTLNPAIAELKDGRVIAYGTMGGDGQPQSQAAVFTRYVTFRQPLERALDAPRWLLGRTWGSTHTNLRMESRFDGNLIDRLLSAGHDVAVLDEPYSDTMGHSGAVVRHPDGSLEGGHDQTVLNSCKSAWVAPALCRTPATRKAWAGLPNHLVASAGLAGSGGFDPFQLGHATHPRAS